MLKGRSGSAAGTEKMFPSGVTVLLTNWRQFNGFGMVPRSKFQRSLEQINAMSLPEIDPVRGKFIL
jgi:hypothetical protein